jgi:hypothetical protein
VRQLRIATLLAGHPTDQIPYRLPSLDAWANGTVIEISAADQGFYGKEAKIPIPARGQPSFGFATASGAESLLYGYGPYPPLGAEPAVQSLFDRCVARSFETSITPHSPVTVTVSGAHGQSSGLNSKGIASAGIPGSIVSHDGKVLRGIALPEGNYALHVTGTGSGPATLVLSADGPGGMTTKVFSFHSHRGAHGTIAIHGGRVGGSMRFGSRTVRAGAGLGLRVRGLPRHLRKGKATQLKLSLRTQLGAPAAGVTVIVGGAAGRHVASTDGKGRLTLTLRSAHRGRVTVAFGGAGYAHLVRRLTVR